MLTTTDERQQQLDQQTIRQWERLHTRYFEYRDGVPRLEEEMRKLAPAYCRAVHRFENGTRLKDLTPERVGAAGVSS